MVYGKPFAMVARVPESEYIWPRFTFICRANQVAIVPLLAWVVDRESSGPRFLWSLPVIMAGALLAIVRKLIILDISPGDAPLLLALAVATLSLGGVYWLVTDQDRRERE